MPPRKNSGKPPPPVMTWFQVSPAFAFAVAIISDSLRLFFTMFWFFGPALAAVYCGAKVTGWVGNLWGLTATVCGAVAVKTGFVSLPVTAVFGTMMAWAAALFGFLALSLVIFMTNARIFKTLAFGAPWLVGSFAISSTPFLGALPAFSVVVWRLYRAQIKTERAAFKKWEAETAAARQEEKRMQLAYLAQAQAAQQAQFAQLAAQEALNDTAYKEAQAASDEIPVSERRAA